MATDETNPSTWVRLNVGGKLFCTTIGTLTLREPDSMLAAMFSGRHTLKLEDGHVLIDRDGDYFGFILNWLRDGDVPAALEAHQYKQLLKEADYFQLRGLIDGIQSIHISDFTRLEIIKCIQSSVKTFQGVNISGVDLSKLELSRTDFVYACLRNVSFSCADLHGTNFDKAVIEGATFCDSNLQDSVFTEANIGEVSFVGANLKCTKFTRANLERTDFSRAMFQSTDFSGTTLSDIDFSKLDLDRINFSKARLRNVRFSGASLKGACFEDVDAEGVVFDSANLEECKFGKSKFRGSSFVAARLTEGKLISASLSNCNFVGAVYSVDETGVDTRDIELIMIQAGVSRSKVVKALQTHNGDIISALIELTN